MNKKLLFKTDDRPIARRVADHFDEIEEAILNGYTKKEIVEKLASLGIEVSVTTLKTILQRLRAKKRKGETPKKLISSSPSGQGDNTATSPNSLVAKSPSLMPAEKQSGKHKPIIASPSSSGNTQSWHDMRQEEVEW